MSVTQDAASPVGGRGWHLSGWGKIGAACVAVTTLSAFIIMPGFFGATTQQQAKSRDQPDSAAVVPFKQPPAGTVAAGQGAPPVAGDPSHGTFHHRLPPPLEIGSYVVLPPPAGSAQPAHPTPAYYDPARGMPPPSSQGGVTPVYVPMPGSGGAAAGPSADSLDGQTSGATVLQASSASILAHPDYTITAGAKIPCLPVEAADSSLGGFYTCRVPEWVRGTTMARGLLPPGTLVFGQIRKGMDEGQERLAVIYTRIETAGDHFVIRLAAPAGDAMGRSGVKGDLDTHFWEKVGDVALYALIDGLQNAISQGASAAANSLAGAGGGNSFLNLNVGSGGGQSLAAMEMQHKINKPPTMRLDQAMPVTVSVGQDLDFFAACQQRMTINPMACPLQ